MAIGHLKQVLVSNCLTTLHSMKNSKLMGSDDSLGFGCHSPYSFLLNLFCCLLYFKRNSQFCFIFLLINDMEIKWNSLKLQVGFADFFQIRKLVSVLEQFGVRLNQTVNIFITALEKTHINRIYRAHLFVPGSKHPRELRAYTVCKE